MHKEILFRELETICHSYMNERDLACIRRSYLFADKAHDGQLRKEGVPYITHPLNAALILARMQVDSPTIVSAILHDVPEDTKYTIEDVESEFGHQVARLVAGITKLSAVHYKNNMVDRQVDTLRKMFLVMAKDIRVILVKLADRLHNVRTLEHVRPDKAARIAKETMEIYAPLAHLLGLWEIRQEIEDCCFKYIDKVEYDKFIKRVDKHRKSLKNYLSFIEKKVKSAFEKNNVNGLISVRWKHTYSVYKKMCKNVQSDFVLYDLPSINIILPDVESCYSTLGLLHAMYRPKPGSFKDYIAVPKLNGYKSLHTIVFGPKGELCEFHLRTLEMDREAKFGIASKFIAAKAGKVAEIDDFLKTSPWVTRIMSLQTKPNDEFLEDVKRNVLSARVFVFSIEGEMMDLPQGATSLDYAYRVSKRTGNEYSFALINKERKPLSYELETGDIVEIVTSHDSMPSRDWLQFVVTEESKRAIKFHFAKSSSKEQEKVGEEALDTALSVLKHGDFRNYSSETKRTIMTHMGFRTVNAMLRAIAIGDISEEQIVKEISNSPETFFSNQTFILKRLFFKLCMQKTRRRNHRVWFKLILDDRIGMLADIVEVISHYKMNIVSMSARPLYFNGKGAIDIFQVEVDDLNNMRRALHAISNLRGVRKISQVNTFRTLLFSLCVMTLFVVGFTVPSIMNVVDFDESWTEILENSYIFLSVIVFMFGAMYYAKKFAVYTLPRSMNKAAFLHIVDGLSIVSFTAVLIGSIAYEIFETPYAFALLILSMVLILVRTAK